MKKSNWIDRVVSYVNPKAGLDRVRARARADLIEGIARKYEGASVGRRTEGWVTKSTDVNAENRAALINLRNRSRDLVRNNGWAERAMSVLENNIIGKGIVTQFYSKNQKTADEINKAWVDWTDSPACDFGERMDFAMMQRLSLRTMAEAGEVLIRIYFGTSKKPLRLQLLEPDFINSSPIKAEGSGNQIIDGIELDGDGRRLAYHLFANHPGSNDLSAIVKSNFETVRVDAKFILHAFKINRPGQLRGVSSFAPTIINLRELDEYLDAQIVKQKISACMTAFITDPQGGSDMDEKDIEIVEKFEPGAINILGPGQEITAVNPPTVEGFGDFITTVLRSVACGLGLSYEALTGDLSQVNFSSARMGWLEMARNIDAWRNQVIIPMILEPVVKAFLMAEKLNGQNIPSDLNWNHTAPRREMIDPTREVPALIDGIRGGLFTLNDVLKQFGSDPTAHLKEIFDMNTNLDKLGIILDSDPRKTSSKGDAQFNPVGA